jgi:hypothetical protein
MDDMRRRELLVLCALTTLSACDRWRSKEPSTLYFRDASGAFTTAQATLQQLGYTVQADSARYHLQVQAKVDDGGTFIALQIYADARMIIRAHGKLVHADKMHRKVGDEVNQIADALRASGQVMR